MTKKERALAIVQRTEQIYPDAVCALEFQGEAWKLMVMGRLSAQCTDARVNIVCRDLFKSYPTAEKLAEADISEVEKIIRPCGLHHSKAKDIVGECDLLCNSYSGKVPCDMDELLKFPGVGRKIANLLLGDLYNMPAIVADTHCIRISARLGLTNKGEKDPVKTETALKKLIPEDKQSDYCHRMVMFGRDTCTARSPKCEDCPLGDLCKKQIV